MTTGKTPKARILALIPARGGSQRVTGKNLREIASKPLIKWTIDAVLASGLADRIMVSTDSNAIAQVALDAGAEVPFMRPDLLASNTATTVDVVAHALDFVEAEGQRYDYLLLLQPTSPLRTSEHIQAALSLLMMRKADAVISVCPAEHSPLWCKTLPDDLAMDSFLPSQQATQRSQDLEQYYRLNGSIYLVNCERFRAENSFFLSSNSYGYCMPAESSVDIDTELDFKWAEFLLNERQRSPTKRA